MNGALLILADDEEEAIEIFTEEESEYSKQVIKLEMTKGIIYDDFIR